MAAAACLLAGPTVLAFFSGGFFAEPRLIAAIVAWAFVLALAATGESLLPRGLPGALALGGLAFLTAWSALSIAWAPLGGPAARASSGSCCTRPLWQSPERRSRCRAWRERRSRRWLPGPRW